MKKLVSGKRLLLGFFCIMLAVTLGCLIACGGYALYTSERQLRYCNRSALNVYMNNLRHVLDDLSTFNDNIVGNDQDFYMLDRYHNKLPIERKLLAEMNLRHVIRSRISGITGVLIFDSDKYVYYFLYGNQFLNGTVTAESRRTMEKIKDFWIEGKEDKLAQWIAYAEDGHAILMNAVRRENLYVCSMVDMQAYSSVYSAGDDPIVFSFFTEDAILTGGDYAGENGVALADMRASVDRTLRMNRAQIVLHGRVDPLYGIGLCGIISTTGIWGYTKVCMAILLLSLGVICCLFLVMYTHMKRMLIYPLNQITKASCRIAEGSDLGEAPEENLKEFEDIRCALQRLVDQKITLERNNVSTTYEKEHAMLQYYQLQTKSHFVLNCLKSIYNLSARGEMEKVLHIITSFSNHIRYAFHDNLSLVSVRAELDEVNDYFRIIQMERADPILLVQNVDPELMDFPIPPMLIQTALENVHKFNGPGRKILRFSVRIDSVEMDGREYVRVRLSDNGVGYSEEVLRMMEHPDADFEQYHVGIQNLRRRMDLLYQKQCQAAFFNNPGGGACSVFYLPKNWKEEAK